MPGLYKVAISEGATPPIEIEMINFSYLEFQLSLGALVYKLQNIYMQSQSLDQIIKTLLFNKKDSSGTQLFTPVVPNIDPYQFQNVLNLDTQNRSIVLDGQVSMKMTLLANTQIVFILDVVKLSLTDILKKDYIFFSDYKEI